MSDPRCADVSLERDEPAWATASVVRGWVLVEQPGAWGRDALFESRLPPAVAEFLVEEGRPHRVRTVLLRQPDRPRTGRRRSFVASSGRPRPWMEHRTLSDPDELLALDVAAAAGPQPVGFGQPWDRPLYLVCTNGRHDPCCARLGRPIVRSLLAGLRGPNAVASRADQVWECSHIGGDRFAGNLVCLPHGLYFGRLEPDEAAEVVARYEAGHIALDHFRGRAGDPFAVQAAEYLLRRETGLTGIDAVTPLAWRRRPGGSSTAVHFATEGGEEVDVEVEVAAAPPRLLTCTAGAEDRPPSYRLAGLIPRAGDAPAVH
ncbi:MAG TPA: sucrase ferredoxin [Acidimicrobiales bacterium]|nr:sucrase ferredoxin [Acidimicrobiales bacterium]